MGEVYMMPGFYDYDPFVEMPTTDMADFGLAGALLGIFAAFYGVMFAFGIVCYILQSIGIYTVAKRRQIHNPWLAWIPVGVLWILGSLSDQYQYVAKGRVRNRRKVLLGVEIAMLLLLIPLIVSTVVLFVSVLQESTAAFGISGILLLLCYLAFVVLAIVQLVYTYIVMYDFFVSCEPGNAVTYLVLSIVFSITQPFFLFFLRKKDLGMPPRKADPQPVVQPVLPVVEQTPAEPVCQETPVEEIPVEDVPEEEIPAEE